MKSPIEAFKDWQWKRNFPDITNVRHVHNMIVPILGQLTNYFDPYKTDTAYHIATIGELHEYLKENDISINSTTGHNMTVDLDQVRDKYAQANEFNGVYYVWSKGEYKWTAVDANDQKQLDSVIKSLTKMFHMNDLYTDRLYISYKELKQFHRYTQRIIQRLDDKSYFEFSVNYHGSPINKEEYNPSFIDQISLNQKFVDYMIKLNTIGSNNNMFNALVKRDEEWISELFRPIAVMNQHIGLVETVDEKQQLHEDELADQQLNEILSWSSTTLFEYQMPHIEPDTIQLDNLFDKAFAPFDEIPKTNTKKE